MMLIAARARSIVRKFGSTQAVLDHASQKKFDARKCLVPIDIDDWLP